MEAQEGKKTSLEELSKEDLIAKCKSLLALAQKVKAAKDTLLEENASLKNQLAKSDVAQELLDRLTEEKLSSVTQIEDLKSKNKSLLEKVKLYEENISTLETENTSYSRQVKRLTDENEQLITDLSALETQISELEKVGIEQRGQLLALEKSNNDSLKDFQSKLTDSLEQVKKLNDNLVNKEQEISELSQELQALKIINNSSVKESNISCDTHINEINDLKHKNKNYNDELTKIQSQNGKLKEKVTLYHTKLKKFALNMKEIKNEKNLVIKLFKSYTEQIKIWKEQLLSASHKLLELVTNLENENRTLHEEKSIQIKEYDNMKLKLETQEKEINHFKDKENKIKETIAEHSGQVEELNKIITNYKNQIDSLTEELKENQFNKTQKDLEDENIQLTNSCATLENQLQKTREELLLKTHELDEYKNQAEERINTLLLSVDKSVDIEQKMREEILRLTGSNKELETKLLESQNDMETLKSNLAKTSEELLYLQNKDENNIDLKRENSELLLEMNHMNQALKERGEIISKMEVHCEEIKKKLQFYETQTNKNVDSLTEKEATIKVLSQELDSLKNNNSNMASENMEINNLKAEIEMLKEKLQNNLDSNYAESETMSTSTISRTEEMNRLKDLEGSWEERYGKLRTLAIKLKAKIREQGNTINELEKERDESMKKLTNNIKTLQNFQNQIDMLQDELEKVKIENKEYLTKLNSVAENISNDKQQLVQKDETIFNLRKEIETLTANKQSTENWKKQISSKVQTLRKELEAKNLLFKDSESKCTKLENDLESMKTQLRTEQESHKQTKSLLEQSAIECKRNSVLNLEMQDYERSVKELSFKIEKLTNEITNLQTQLELQKTTTNALREQNKILEERIQEEEKNGNSTSLEISSYKKTVANLEEVLQQKENKILDTTKLLETVRSENEELSTELSKVIAEHQKSFNAIKTERDQLRGQILTIQQNLRDMQDTLKLREEELETVKDEYENYKVRAQSVLKKNQNRDIGLEEKLSEEVAAVKMQNGKLKEELEKIREDFDKEQADNKELSKKRDELIRKLKELEMEVEEVKNYNHQANEKYQKTVNEHTETVRSLKIHAETLSQCYRQQLSEQEVRHNQEIIELQSRIEKAPSPIELVHLNMPREEGEGSESIESNPALLNLHPIPLERLLDSKLDEETIQLKKSLLEQESKVTHLTALLSDTEQDLAKHVQMNRLLKEEIRRQQRSVEREKHAENLEYLKNVVFKFVTLNSGDERTRLVPVMNTILKLSPEETQKLVSVAKGEPGIKGWTSYLPTWSSPNKPQ